METPPDSQPNADHRDTSDGLYSELRRLVRSLTRGDRVPGLLQTTALVHETWLRLVKSDPSHSKKSDVEFAALASKTIRSVLVDEARREGRAKRGGKWRRISLSDELASEAHPSQSVDVLAIDAALTELAQLSERRARVVEMRFFGAMAMDRIAKTLEVSKRTVENDWEAARAWLRVRLVELGVEEQQP